MKLCENLQMKIGYCVEDIRAEISKRYSINKYMIDNIVILKESIDARHKPNVFYRVNVAFSCKDGKYNKGLEDVDVSYDGIAEEKLDGKFARPVVVGFGPAGMFMALKLAKCGLKPIVLEQGDSVEKRKEKILDFWHSGDLDVYSNVHFGEGGAGTFSDGKLNSNISNEYCKIVTNELIKHGAPSEIYYKAKPHIGTDKLIGVVRSIREDVISLGGEVRFGSKLIDINIADGKVAGAVVEDMYQHTTYIIDTSVVVLAIGHSAKETFGVLKSKGVEMKQKPFAMGVRIEQKQKDINMAQYGVVDCRLPNADYKLVEHLHNGRSVFTFCMCPGGLVVASTSEKNSIVTNGMSYFARDRENANSALLVNVEPKDFGSDDILAGFDYQAKYERLAFDLGGGVYYAPAMKVGDFLGTGSVEYVKPSYKPGVKYVDITKCLPPFVAESIKLALPKFERKIKNFAHPGNVLTAIESRSSCPVQIVRGDNKETNFAGLYAIGEGAGYAGGIMSSAQDGLKVAEKVIEYLAKK